MPVHNYMSNVNICIVIINGISPWQFHLSHVNCVYFCAVIQIFENSFTESTMYLKPGAHHIMNHSNKIIEV